MDLFNQQPPPLSTQPVTATQLKHRNPMSLITTLVIAVLFLLASLAFGAWAYSSRQDYKNNSDKKSAAAVKAAEEALNKKLEADFAEREKLPTKTYTSPSTAGTLSISYPKTWSAYVSQDEKSATPVDGYFYPDFVPTLQSGKSFALRIEVVSQTYDQVMKQFDSSVKTGKAKVSPFRPAKVQSVLGSRIDGDIGSNKQGSMVVLPLRDKAIRISTESQSFMSDFDDIILASLSFSP
ncbi:MAG TPA: hypothetical protein VLG25_03340 [Patescibacteria group bacterium]|nr:hypothetical protein [Patescibacteria group bacterium]